MEATPETFAVLDGAYWLDAPAGDRAHHAHCENCALLFSDAAPDPLPEGGPDGVLDRVQGALTRAHAGRLRALMLTWSLGTVIAGAASALRR
uniref:Uncharacterized protein n=1 Tax=Streptomyces sp. NBC_00049 TaxID=2903617 RepID=A0AAU2K0R5_9ACTN